MVKDVKGGWVKMIGRSSLQISAFEMQVMDLMFPEGAESPPVQLSGVRGYYRSEYDYFVPTSDYVKSETPRLNRFYWLLSDEGKQQYERMAGCGESFIGEGILIATGLEKKGEMDVVVSLRHRKPDDIGIYIDSMLSLDVQHPDFQEYIEKITERNGSDFDIEAFTFKRSRLMLRREISIDEGGIRGVISRFHCGDELECGVSSIFGVTKTNASVSRGRVRDVKLMEDARLLLGDIVGKMAEKLKESGIDVGVDPNSGPER